MNQDTTNASVTAERPISRSAIISIRFQLVNPSRAESSLQCKIGVNGKYATEFVVERNIRTVNWAQKLQKMLDDSEESALLNQRLAFIKSEIKKAEMRLRLDGRPITAASIKNAYLEAQGMIKVEPKPVVVKRPTFHDCFREFYHKKSTQKRKPITERTRQSYWRYKSNLDKYMKFLQVKKLYADQITHEWAERYLDWLIDKAKFANDYANNNIQLLKSVLQMAENSHLIDKNPLKGYKLFDNNYYDTTHLTIEEVNTLASFDFSTIVLHEKAAKTLREEADIFVFSCFTAQHHCDLKERNYELFEHPTDGRIWLKGKRRKTGVAYSMPLHPIALAIVNKYEGINNLPVKANTKRNYHLKHIAVHCGIKIRLTTKVGRKTFSNFALNTLRMREETVAAILGHQNTKFVKRYAKITEESIAAEYRF
ncbi:site-specific integrase [Runella limosa]|uniref:site-specific integrase n=1 Tax=Runella limosa TaxID=370978 RepID=UPI0004241488|nr:site-specific integrase [Runella limosa]